VSLRLCEVLQFKGGKIMSGRLYFDAATLMQQLVVNTGGKGDDRP
jgi:limonene-1,2-epoxide hydrolase